MTNKEFPQKMLLQKINLELDGNGERYIDPKSKEMYLVFKVGHQGAGIYIRGKIPVIDKEGTVTLNNKD